MDLWEKIAGDGKRIFVDLKVPDIGNTVADVVRDLREDPSVRFLTLHQNMQLRDIAMARDAKAGSRVAGAPCRSVRLQPGCGRLLRGLPRPRRLGASP